MQFQACINPNCGWVSHQILLPNLFLALVSSFFYLGNLRVYCIMSPRHFFCHAPLRPPVTYMFAMTAAFMTKAAAWKESWRFWPPRRVVVDLKRRYRNSQNEMIHFMSLSSSSQKESSWLIISFHASFILSSHPMTVGLPSQSDLPYFVRND